MRNLKNRIVLTLLFAIAFSGVLCAQEYTYNHDDSKCNQFTVGEIGIGGLTPAFYYNLLHSSYQKTAAEQNKSTYRAEAFAGLYEQRDNAEDIDSALTKRAEIEALNVADRELDLAWLAEQDKFHNQMNRFYSNINYIVFCGGGVEDRKRWLEIYNAFDMAANEVRDAYEPNAQRKQAYLDLYADITKQNEILVKQLAMFSSNTKAKKLLAVSGDAYSKANKADILSEARGRWKVSTADAQTPLNN